MVLVTKYKATNVKTGFLVFAFVAVALLVILFFTDFIPLKQTPYLVVVLSALIYIYYMGKKFMYIHYNDESEKIILRFFKIIPSTLDHHAIEIPKKTFVKFEVKKSFMGLREELVLVQRTKNGIAKYPPVSISILSDSQKTELKNSLTAIAQANR
jgi:hypothetical protein